MWEFSLNLKSENFELAKYFHNTLNNFVQTIKGMVTSNEDNGYISVLIAVPNNHIEEIKSMLLYLISEVICVNFKSEYLNSQLFLPELDNSSIFAFKRALLNFDKETDRYIIKKNLVLENNLYLESFYRFRLKSLHDKWEELVSLSNENKEYLISRESFIDLLKFLVDNLDICAEEISIIKEKNGYRIFLEDGESDDFITEESIVSSVIDLSPQKINLYFNESTNEIKLLERIFEERIIINDSSFQNVKKFKIN